MTLKYNNNKNDKRFRYYKATTNSEPIQLYKEVKEDQPYTLTISSNAYDKTGTYYATMGAIGNGNFKVPQGIEVSSIIVNESKKIVPTQTYTFEEGDILDGKEAYLIEAKSANSYTFTPTTEGVTKPIGLNMLYPATAGEQISAPDGGTNDEYKFYQLSRNSNKELGSVGFYYGPNCTLGQPFSFTNPNKAYLAVPASIATGASIGLFDGFDGIADAIVNEGAQRSVYTLTGVRVDSKQLPKGIYIIDGKKQVVK